MLGKTLNTTKRWLIDVAYSGAGNFVVPFLNEGVLIMLNARTAKPCKEASIVYIGIEISESDVFKKLVDTKLKIHDVKEVHCEISKWIVAIKSARFGTKYIINNGALLENGRVS